MYSYYLKMSMGANSTAPYIQLVSLCVLLHQLKIKSLICELNSLKLRTQNSELRSLFNIKYEELAT